MVIMLILCSKVIDHPLENPEWITDRDWAGYQKVFWDTDQKIEELFRQNFCHRNKFNFSILDIGAGQGLAAEFWKDAGAYIYDNLALASSHNPFIDHEYLGNIDRFDFSVLPEYDLMISCLGGLYYGQRVLNNVLQLLSHLKPNGQIIANTGWYSNDSMNITAEYLRKKHYQIEYAHGLLYINKGHKSGILDYQDLQKYYTERAAQLNKLYDYLLPVKTDQDDLLPMLMLKKAIGSHVYNRLISWASNEKRLASLFNFSNILYDHFQITGNNDPQKQTRLEEYLLQRFLAGQYPDLNVFISELKTELQPIKEEWQIIDWFKYGIPYVLNQVRNQAN